VLMLSAAVSAQRANYIHRRLNEQREVTRISNLRRNQVYRQSRRSSGRPFGSGTRRSSSSVSRTPPRRGGAPTQGRTLNPNMVRWSSENYEHHHRNEQQQQPQQQQSEYVQESSLGGGQEGVDDCDNNGDDDRDALIIEAGTHSVDSVDTPPDGNASATDGNNNEESSRGHQDESLNDNNTNQQVTPTTTMPARRPLANEGSRVVYGMPTSTLFSGASQYPFSSFVDPENEFENDFDESSWENEVTHNPQFYSVDDRDDIDREAGDNWTDEQVLEEYQLYWKNKENIEEQPWGKLRSDWINGCIVRRNGLALKAQNALPCRPFCEIKKQEAAKRGSDGSSTNWDNCIICLENFQKESLDPLYTLYCGHVFHRDCLRSWLRKSRFCPYCRDDLAAPKTLTAKIKVKLQTAANFFIT